MLRCWHGYLCRARCSLFAYGSTIATAIPASKILLPLVSLKSRMFYLFAAGLFRCSGKQAIKFVLFCLFSCPVTSRSRTRRVRRHSTVRRNLSTVRPTASENTKIRTRPSSTKMGRSLVSTEVARRAASGLTRMGRHRRHCRHSYNARSGPFTHLPLRPAYFMTTAMVPTTTDVVAVVLGAFCIPNQTWLWLTC